jgi:hypothetical protein
MRSTPITIVLASRLEDDLDGAIGLLLEHLVHATSLLSSDLRVLRVSGALVPTGDGV